jgi:hypothetical protein
MRTPVQFGVTDGAIDVTSAMCMRTPVRFGATDGAIDVTSAVGKVSDI